MDEEKRGINIDSDNGDHVHISSANGINVSTQKGEEVHISFKDGINVTEKNVSSPDSETYKKPVTDKPSKLDLFAKAPISLLAIIAFLLVGFLTNKWHPTWMIFLLVPLATSLIDVFVKKDLARFAYPVLCLDVYLFLGFFYNGWHPWWVVFLTIPIFYWIAHFVKWGKEK